MRILFWPILLGLLGVNSFASESPWSQIIPSSQIRYKYISQAENLEDTSRNFHNLRLRIGLVYLVDNYRSLHFRLGSGGAATISNDNLGDSEGRPDEIFWDRAYISQRYSKIDLKLGRMPNPFYRSGGNQLIWDSDFNFEGANINYISDNFTARLSSTWFKENIETNTDVTILSSQLEYHRVTKNTSYNLGISNYKYQFAKEANLSTYGDDVNLLELFFNIDFKTSIPFAVWTSVVNNLAASEDNRGFIVGSTIGNNMPSTWKLGMSYREIELKSIYGPLTDNTFGSENYPTDASGGKVWLRYTLDAKSYIKMAAYAIELNRAQKANPDRNKASKDRYEMEYVLSF